MGAEVTIACVLRSGGDFRPSHVAHLRAGVRAHLTLPHRFVCLTDMGLDCETIPLRHGWPGWWSKLELFHPDMRALGPIFYADLDTVITGPLDDIVLGHRFTLLQSFWKASRIGSGLMAWDADLSAMYRTFALDPGRFMREYTTTERWGDQGFIRDHWPFEPERWQTKFPGRVVSYKGHCRPGVPMQSASAKECTVPAGASVVCFHGQPRPWQTKLWAA